ncbi:P-loop containing nucleoside triphosphate hydrolase [Pseudocohnilembus persalinus]|uniref:p-loop containing nucleoside triphosphate hydrolase n=1 Tax=Pseudocohnilembus persalinus TaxID=266149 RepID=A0A0V0QUV0_PSEPJ|nr:P-loop containing nucleoside triphosphate hydrolase [Pseudocohnilembus persalinus]|eukprot:KRX05818.1 P-loop containing nucleoside triphosphate hydrolase [Pseudocohnilembus persalinus]
MEDKNKISMQFDQAFDYVCSIYENLKNNNNKSDNIQSNIIIYSPPGNGKTFLIKNLIKKYQQKFNLPKQKEVNTNQEEKYLQYLYENIIQYNFEIYQKYKYEFDWEKDNIAHLMIQKYLQQSISRNYLFIVDQYEGETPFSSQNDEFNIKFRKDFEAEFLKLQEQQKNGSVHKTLTIISTQEIENVFSKQFLSNFQVIEIQLPNDFEKQKIIKQLTFEKNLELDKEHLASILNNNTFSDINQNLKKLEMNVLWK